MDNRFQEPEYVGNIPRVTYLSDIEKLIDQRRAGSQAVRDRRMAELDRETLRQDFRKMLGWPLVDYDPGDFRPTMQLSPMGEDDMVQLFRVQVEAMPGLRFGGVLMRRHGGERLPLVICQHGGLGTPEFVYGMYKGGTANYNDMTRRVLARNVHVFSPQLLLWNQDTYHVHYDRQAIDNRLKQLGGSISALEIFCIQKSIDVLSGLDWVDESRVGMVGLSYGGFYTLFTAAVDTRIRSALSAGFLNDRMGLDWADWVWQDAGHTFLDAEVGALVAPRGLHLQLGTRDELFAEAPARREFERMKAFFDRAGCPEKLSMEFFDGTHEFSRSEESIDRFMKDLL